MRGNRAEVDVARGPDASGKFLTYVDGGMEMWTIDDVKRYAAEPGHVISERKGTK